MFTIHQLSNDYYLLRTTEPDFNRNIYLRTYRNADKVVNLIMDPGSRQDLEPLTATLQKLIGGVKNLSAIFLSHQDPDLTGNLAALLQYSQAFVLTSEDTWRLLRTAGLDDKRFIATEGFQNGMMRLRTGHIIQTIPAYFCHFRGATMLYDRDSGILFTGDLLGGLLSRKSDGYLATEESLSGVTAFHRLYMPTNRAVAEAIRRIKGLNPPPLLIAPQHGDIINAEMQPFFLERLSSVPMGIDTIVEEDVPSEALLRVFNKALQALSTADKDVHKEFFKAISDGGNFTPYFIFKGSQMTQVKVDYYTATEQFMTAVREFLPMAIGDQIKTTLFNEISELGLRLPQSLISNLSNIDAREFLSY